MITGLQTGGDRRMRSLLRQMQASSHQPPEALAGALPLFDVALGAGKDALRRAGLGWYPDSDVSVSPHPGLPILLELVGFKRIELRLNPETLTQRAAALQSVVSVENPLIIVQNAVRSLVRLFAGYYDLCPRDLWGHRRLIEAASWGAYRTYYPSERAARIATAISLFFERTIVTHLLTLSEGAGFVSGLALERALNQHPPNLLSSLLQRSQAVLLPAAWENALRICPVMPDPTADALLEEVLFILFRARLRTGGGRLRLRGRIRCPVSWEWEKRVEELAEVLVPYVEQDPRSSGPHTPLFVSSDSTGNSRDPSDPSRGLPSSDPSDLANPFAPSGNGSRQPASFLGNATGLLPGRGRGQGINCTFEQIEEYYSHQAQTLRVKDDHAEQHAGEPEMLPVGFLDYAPADLRDLVCGQIDWFRTKRSPPSRENPSGLQLFRQTDPLEIPADAFEPGRRNIPNLLLVVDSSGSMNFNPHRTTDRGKYDVVLMACWGLFRFITERGLGDLVWFNALNFSGQTQSSGWHRGNDLIPVKRVLAAYEGGGTALDTSVLRSALESSPGRFMMVTMTDGSLSNTTDALTELRRAMEAGNSLVLLHIGTPNGFTEGVRRLGGSVHILNHAHELLGLCLDLARANYGDKERRNR